MTRRGDGPIIDAGTHPSIGGNIQGPSAIECPAWLPDAPGRFLLYFADHKGSYIRLAHADEVTGPWTVHPPGSLQLADSCFLTEPPPSTPEQLDELRQLYDELLGSSDLAHSLTYEATTPHIASPDVHVDHGARRFVMYLHGLDGLGMQVSRAATSTDGVRFVGRPEVLGPPYLRAFAHGGQTYALTMPGTFLRSQDGLTGFEAGPSLFEPAMRHAAVLVRDETLHVLWTRVGDAPEAILHTPIQLGGDWSTWTMGPTTEVLRPERAWEGADAPVEPSIRSVAPPHVNQLRDPALLEVDGQLWLFYAVGGESGIAVAELTL